MRYDVQSERSFAFIAAQHTDTYIAMFKDLLVRNGSPDLWHILQALMQSDFQRLQYGHFRCRARVMDMEKRSGRGNIRPSQRGQAIDWTQADLAFEVQQFHDLAQLCRSNVMAADAQVRLADHVLEAEDEFVREFRPAQRSRYIRETLLMHREIVDRTCTNLRYWQTRAEHQISVVGTTAEAIIDADTDARGPARDHLLIACCRKREP